MYAYGGYNISMPPSYQEMVTQIVVPQWVEQGGIFVQCNLRGGSEYGPKWHEGGMAMAKRHGVLVSFDPNIRGELRWGGEARERMLRMASQADILKPTLAEARQLTGREDVWEILDVLHGMGPKLVAISQDKDGALLSAGGQVVASPGIDVPVVDPTGAGDCFAAALCRCVQRDMPLEEAARFCNCVGTLVCTKRGAVGMAIPSEAEVEELMASGLCRAERLIRPGVDETEQGRGA